MSRQPDDHSWEEEFIFNLEKEMQELKCQLELTKYNLVYILKHNKNLLLPPTLKFKDIV